MVKAGATCRYAGSPYHLLSIILPVASMLSYLVPSSDFTSSVPAERRFDGLTDLITFAAGVSMTPLNDWIFELTMAAIIPRRRNTSFLIRGMPYAGKSTRL